MPQLLAELLRFASQPLDGFMSQSAYPMLHAKPQAPASHPGVALSGEAHDMHIVPHDRTLVLERQLVPQAWVPAGHPASVESAPVSGPIVVPVSPGPPPSGVVVTT